MFKMLKPRWLTVLTGVAVCTLMCAYTASDSWAAMCMVGYDTSACEGSGSSAKPACDPTKEKCGPTVNPPSQCPNKGATVTTDCQRLGYSERGAKPYPATLWPTKALKNGENNTSKWKCDPCRNGTEIVYDNSCYARYNCYASCQDESAATNVNGAQGPITGWGKNTTIGSGINRKSRAYRDQFVRSQAECDILFGTKTGASGRLISERKFYWITKNICGACEERLCDGVEVIDGCYEVCDNKYTLEDGTKCCNQLDELVSMNPYSGDANYWYPSTSPLYHHSGCYNTERKVTAYGDFNDLGAESEGKYCYHQTPMTCEDRCEEPKEDNNCTCGPKACETLSTETGKPFSASHSNITENSVIYHFDNGEVEKVNGICYQKTPVSSCPSTGCYTLSRLTCPNGEPDSDCSCGVGCPSGSIPESEYNSNYAYINGKVLKDGAGNDKDFCLELSSDGATCATWSKCYEYDECSDLGDFLVADGSGGCMCGGTDSQGRAWKEEASGCDIGNYIEEKLFSPPAEGNIYKHDTTTPIDAIRCKTYNGVICTGVLAAGPDSNCECQCTGDYSDYYLNTTYNGYSDWIANLWTRSEALSACAIGTYTPTEFINKEGNIAYGYWTDKTGREDIEVICHRYDTVECPSGTSRNSDCGCECDSGSTAKGSDYSDADKPADTADTVYNYSIDHASYTDTDGGTQYISCYYAGDVTCGDDEVLTEEGCVGCSSGYSTESNAGCDPCGQYFDEKETIDGKNGDKLVCGVCANKEAKTCEEAGYLSSNTTPMPNGDNEWWCAIESTSDCVAWENGSAVSCYKGTQTNSQKAASAGYGVCPPLPGYTTDPCPSGQVEVNNCYLACREKWQCISYVCPRFTESTCSGEFALSNVSTCKNENQGFCIIDGKYYKTQDDVTDGIGLDERDDI